MPTAPAAASPRLAAPAPHRLLVFSRAAFQMLISALGSCCCDLFWVWVWDPPGPQQPAALAARALPDSGRASRQAGNAHPHRSWGPRMSLRTATYPAGADRDPLSLCPSSTIIRSHGGGLSSPSQFLLSHHAGNEHSSYHGGQAGGDALLWAPALQSR